MNFATPPGPVLTGTAASDPNARPFVLGYNVFQGVNGADPRPNTVWSLGYNMKPGNGRFDPTEASFGISMEDYYVQNGVAAHEFHITGTDLNGVEHRPLSAFMPRDGGPGSSLTLSGDKVVLQTYAGAATAQFNLAANNLALGSGFQFVFNGNNTPPFVQRNASGSSFMSLPYLDNQDRLRLGGNFVAVGATPTSGTYANTFGVYQATSLASGGTLLLTQGPAVNGWATGVDTVVSANTGLVNRIYNSANVPGADVSLKLLARENGGSPFMDFQVNGATNWRIGSDKGDGSKFKISSGQFRGGADYLSIAQNGAVSIAGGVQSLYDRYGDGVPEGTVAAPVGATYHNRFGGAGTSLWVKASGGVTANGWVSTQGAQGPAGPAGPQGIQGVQGVKGDTGPAGETGLPGLKGDAGLPGEKGDTGASGVQGLAGPKGDIGVQGLAGPKGDTGDAGPAGPKGDLGPQGLTGAKGDTGDAGPAGPKGDLGPQGLTGAKGDTGDAGPAGPKGDLGPQGLTGAKGDTGAQGLTGPQGQAGTGVNTKQFALKKWRSYSAATIDLGGAQRGVAFDGDNMWIVSTVTSAGSGTIAKVRASDGTVIGRYKTGKTPTDAAFDGANVWLTNQADGTVSKIRASDGTMIGSYPAGAQPTRIVCDGTNVWVSNPTSGTVTRVNCANPTVGTTSYPTGVGQPQGLAFDGTYLWVPGGPVVARLLASNPSSATLFNIPALNATSATYDGSSVWIADSGQPKVVKLRPTDGIVLGAFTVGNQPADVLADGSNIWVANAGDNTVTKLGSDGSVVATYPTATKPFAMGFDGTNVWLTNQSNFVNKY